jgi:hypothetical protein
LPRSAKESSRPDWKDWLNLATVLQMLDWIVDDEPEMPRASGGLLNSFGGIPATGDRQRRSRLVAWRTSPLQGALSYDARAKLLEVLPGIDSIGLSRPERVRVLHTRLPELRAVAWLRQHADYRSAVSTAQKVYEPRKTEEDKIWLELRLLRAIEKPLLDYQVFAGPGVRPAFPTREKLDGAARHARQLANFLQQHTGLFTGEEGLSWGVRLNAQQVADQLGALVKQYRKPLDESALKLQFMHAVASALETEFGSCSSTVLQRICSLIGYDLDARQAQRKASSVNTGGERGKGAG